MGVHRNYSRGEGGKSVLGFPERANNTNRKNRLTGSQNTENALKITNFRFRGSPSTPGPHPLEDMLVIDPCFGQTI